MVVKNNVPILELKNICKYYEKPDKSKKIILEDINLTLQNREIVGILGRSGSGKSTLLRIISGLITESSGEILYNGQNTPLPRSALAMVFQAFALFPWLTALQNVAIGLEAQGIEEDEIYKRALNAISIIGLDGYEHAYPKELSGGMKQRIGFARALVTNPKILLLDEAFSALDILTATELRAEFLDLWAVKKTGLQSILIVTHNIEEAVLLCDRVLIFSSNPGKIVSEMEITIPHPRNRHDPEVRNLVDSIYTIMTNTLAENHATEPLAKLISDIDLLAQISTNKLNGVIEILFAHPYNGKADAYKLSEQLSLTIDGLFPILELLKILKLASIEKGDVHLTAAGKMYAEADTDERKQIFASHLVENIPLVNRIRLALQQAKRKKIHRRHFIEELLKTLTEEQANKLLTIVINYARYAEIFSYNHSSKTFCLGNDKKLVSK